MGRGSARRRGGSGGVVRPSPEPPSPPPAPAAATAPVPTEAPAPPPPPPSAAPAAPRPPDPVMAEREAIVARVRPALISTDGKIVALIAYPDSNDYGDIGVWMTLSLYEVARERRVTSIDDPTNGTPAVIGARL